MRPPIFRLSFSSGRFFDSSIGTPQEFLAQRGPQSRPVIEREISVLYPDGIRHHLVIPATIVITADALGDLAVGNVQHEVSGSEQSYRTGAVVRRDWQVVGVRKTGDFARFGQSAAPGYIGHDDVRRVQL